MADFIFKKENKKLKCIYRFDFFYGFNLEKLKTEDGILIRGTFFINRYIEHKIIDDTIEFLIGELEDEYYKLDRKVFSTENNFYFYKDINLKANYFFQTNKI